MPHILEVQRLPETIVPGKRLGRHVLHDSRSKRFAVQPRRGGWKTVRHVRHVPVWDQGDLGSCTGNAALGALGTGRLYEAAKGYNVPFTEETAVGVYSAATKIDPYEGTYLPTDTGSDGLSVAKVLHKNGWISGHRHALSLDAALTGLQDDAVITGTVWPEGFDEPDADGLVKYEGQERGGHEYVVDEMDVENRLVWFTNSWGLGYGKNGRACMTWETWGKLLANHGDVTVLVPLTQPAPTPQDPPAPGLDVDKILASAAHEWLDKHPMFYRSFQTTMKGWLNAKGL